MLRLGKAWSTCCIWTKEEAMAKKPKLFYDGYKMRERLPGERLHSPALIVLKLLTIPVLVIAGMFRHVRPKNP